MHLAISNSIVHEFIDYFLSMSTYKTLTFITVGETVRNLFSIVATRARILHTIDLLPTSTNGRRSLNQPKVLYSLVNQTLWSQGAYNLLSISAL